jgi:cbb3-type cytochrome oxidase subunit 1
MRPANGATMHTISNNFLRLAVIAAVIGMIWGNIMGATHDHTTSSAHAHLNLLGWVSMTLYGLFYRVVPSAAGRLAVAHFWINLLGVVIMIPSLAVILVQDPRFLPIAAITLPLAGMLVLASMVLFAVIVFRATGRKALAV